MRNRIQKIIALITVISIFSSGMYGCSDNSEKKAENETEVTTYYHPEMTVEDITLTYMCWQDIEISEALEKEFEVYYPNIDVVVKQYDVSSSSNELSSLYASGKLPDAFWILGSLDYYITEGYLYDMTEFWENDPDTKNIIKGINEFKLGYLGTDSKWVTPAKFFPTAAFLNLDVFNRNDMKMPDMDWTWDEFENAVEEMTIEDKITGKHVFGTTSGCSVITWYPLASDKECIGEFGWNGTEFDLDNWIYGINLEAEWIENENKPQHLIYRGVEQLEEKYGEGVLYPQDIGYSAIHLDHWWTWEDYWIVEDWIIDNKVVFVPYMMPHTEDAQGGNYLATMDMGAISANTEHPYEAYELLKFMTWGTEGWLHKLELYPYLLEESTGEERLVSKNHCPITLDEAIWDGFVKWHPNTEEGDDEIIQKYGEEYDRAPYFDYFFEQVQKSTWTCYGGQQILGFSDWYENVYNGNDGKHFYGFEYALGIEDACIYGDSDPANYYEEIEREGKIIVEKKLEYILDKVNTKE